MNQGATTWATLGLAALLTGGSLLYGHAQASQLAVAAAKKKPCSKATPCFTQTNRGTGAAIAGVSLEAMRGNYGQAAILAQANGIGGIYSYSKQSYGGEFESAGTAYALIAATDNPTGTAFLAEGPVDGSGTGNTIEALSQTPQSGVTGQGAIVAQANGMVGISASSKNNIAGFFRAPVTGLYVVGSNEDSTPLIVDGSSPVHAFFVDGSGNGLFAGDVRAQAFIVDSKRDGKTVGAFALESTRASIEDVGSARMTNGRGIIRFDEAFARAIDASSGYQVFLTPGGDTHGLYVAEKFAGGFIVRESEGGRSSIAFDYRVVARPAGASSARLPELYERKPPRLRRPTP